MLQLIRFGGNPIISPRPDKIWEAGGTFNPGAVSAGDAIHLLYRAVDTNRISRLGYAKMSSGTGLPFRSSTPVLEPSADWERFGCEDPRITHIDNIFYITYTAFSQRGPRLALASTKDFLHFSKYGLVGPDRDDKDFVIFPERINGKIAILHRLESKVQIAYFKDLGALTSSQGYWDDYLKHIDDYEVLRPEFQWEKFKVGVGPPPIKTDRGWLVIYHGIDVNQVYRAGAVLLDLHDPEKILSRSKEPILEPKTAFEKQGIVSNVVFPTGAVILEKELLVYYGGADRVCCIASAPIDKFLDELENEPQHHFKHLEH